jgi:signal transduction histidine kinase/CheY-like chemotaxis protein
MKRLLPDTLRARFMAVVLVTTFVALLVNAVALLLLEFTTYREAQLTDVQTRAEILARASAAALAFDDRKDAEASLAVLKDNAEVLAAALYKSDGRLYAFYTRGTRRVPARADAEAGFHFRTDHIEGMYPVTQQGNLIGMLYLSTRTDLYTRMGHYVGVLAAVMLFALALAFVISSRLQRSFTLPIRNIAQTARNVVEHGDYSVRARQESSNEIGLLADAFNRMLEEVQRRTTALMDEMAEREHAEAALRQADRRKDEFLATLAHELRNPLAPITNSLHILRARAPADPEVVWARDVVERQVRHMARLLDDLLDVGRITSNKLRLRRSRVPLGSIIDSAVETSRPVVSAGGHTLSIDVPPEPVWIEADAVRLAQVFSNLINNAAKYTEAKGHIALTVRPAGREVVVTVSDDGIGISPDILPHVFEMFSQATPAIDRSQGGLGIGLFLVRSLVELHGGRVSASSAGPGEGSEFSVWLPSAPAPQAGAASPAGDEAPMPAKRRILVADDNPDAVDTLAALLEFSGYEVRIARDGQEAFDLAASFRPQLALLDIGMPKLTGYEVARRIRAEPWGRSIILIAVTGWGQEEDKRQAMEAGFEHHITKPADGERLEHLLREVLH